MNGDVRWKIEKNCHIIFDGSKVRFNGKETTKISSNPIPEKCSTIRLDVKIINENSSCKFLLGVEGEAPNRRPSVLYNRSLDIFHCRNKQERLYSTDNDKDENESDKSFNSEASGNKLIPEEEVSLVLTRLNTGVHSLYKVGISKDGNEILDKDQRIIFGANIQFLIVFKATDGNKETVISTSFSHESIGKFCNW